MLNVYLKNKETSQEMWVNFPLRSEDIQNLSENFEKGTFAEILAAETSLNDLHAHLKGKFFDSGNTRYELEYLEKRIEGLTATEKDIFTAALNIEKPISVMEIVNLSCNLDKLKLFPEVNDTTQLGEYLLGKDGQSIADSDPTEIGEKYFKSHAGCFSESGYVMRTGEPLQVIYNGKELPDPAFERNSVFILHLYTSQYAEEHWGTYAISLPASEEKLKLAMENLQVSNLNEASIQYFVTDNSLENYLPVSYTIDELNTFAKTVQENHLLESEAILDKAKAVLTAERPETIQSAVKIISNLRMYDVLPESVQTPKQYAEYIMQKENIYADPQLEDYIDLDSFGEDRIEHDGAVQTVYGLVVCENHRIHQLPEYKEQTRLFSPLTATFYHKNEYGEVSNDFEEFSQVDLCAYEEDIADQIEMSKLDSEGERGLAVYLENKLMARKINSLNPTVEILNGQLWGVLEVESYGILSEAELEFVKSYWSGQASDGWGEGFEQCPISLQDGELYVSFWNSGDDFFISTEEQMKQSMQTQGMQMGGM